MTFPAGPRPDAQPPRDGGPAARPEAGADGAFAALYDRHAGAMHALAMRIAGEPGAAEAVVQEVFAAAWSAAGRRAGGAPPDAHGLLAATRVRAVERLRAGVAAGESAPAVPVDDDVLPAHRPAPRRSWSCNGLSPWITPTGGHAHISANVQVGIRMYRR